MKSFLVSIADLWRECEGDLDRLTVQEKEAFNRYMWEHVAYIDRLRALDEALKTWGFEQEGRK